MSDRETVVPESVAWARAALAKLMYAERERQRIARLLAALKAEGRA